MDIVDVVGSDSGVQPGLPGFPSAGSESVVLDVVFRLLSGPLGSREMAHLGDERVARFETYGRGVVPSHVDIAVREATEKIGEDGAADLVVELGCHKDTCAVKAYDTSVVGQDQDHVVPGAMLV